MKSFADTNWIIAAFSLSNRTAIVERFQRRYPVPWTISPPVLAECRLVFNRKFNSAQSAEWKQLCAMIGNRIKLELEWENLEPEFNKLTDKYGGKGTLGTLDLFVLASAKAASCTHFLSFDTGSNLRALAFLERLQVVPTMSHEDKGRLAAFKA